MRVVVQRVIEASVHIDNTEHAAIGKGFLILLGIEDGDGDEDIQWLCRKIAALRVFADGDGQMNLSIDVAGGEILVVSQFTLHASTKKGNRPSFIRAARPDVAVPLYEKFIVEMAQATSQQVQSGVFGAYMHIASINDGPVTIIMDSKLRE